MWLREWWWKKGRRGRLGTWPSSSSSSPPSSSPDVTEDETGERNCLLWFEAKENPLIEIGSEGEVVLLVAGFETLLLLLLLLSFESRDRRVVRFGVDLDWKPLGTGGGLRGFPLLWGGILDVVSSSRRIETTCIDAERIRDERSPSTKLVFWLLRQPSFSMLHPLRRQC